MDMSGEQIIAECSTPEEFIASVQKQPEAWTMGIHRIVLTVIALRNENAQLGVDYTHARTEIQFHQTKTDKYKAKAATHETQLREVSAQLQEVTAQLQGGLKNQVKLREVTLSEERLHRLRDQYHDKNDELKEQVQTLQNKVNTLQSQLHTQHADTEGDKETPRRPPPVHRPHSFSESEPSPLRLQSRTNRSHSYSESEPSPLRLQPQPTNPGTAPRRIHTYTPVTNITSSTPIEPGRNKRYPDIKDFHGNSNDRDTWDSWKLHLRAKFKASAILFPSEWDKIDYIRDHCKSIAFEVIKARANPDSDNPYNTADETIRDLDSMFGVYDPIAKAESELHDSDFGMGGKNPKETFDEFLARFFSVVAPLGFTDFYKISNMRRLLSDRLKRKLADGIIYKTFGQYVTHCRQCDLDM